MPNSRAACCAFSGSREAMAITSHHAPRCMGGTTFLLMLAAPSTPQRILEAMDALRYQGARLADRGAGGATGFRQIHLARTAGNYGHFVGLDAADSGRRRHRSDHSRPSIPRHALPVAAAAADRAAGV